MRGQPRLADAQALAVASEQLDQRVVAKGLTARSALAADEEDERTPALGRPLVHDVGAQGVKCVGLVQVDHTFLARLGPHPFRVIRAMAHHDAAAPILDVFQV